MEHSNAALVRHLYDARARNDLDAVRSMLPAEIVWHEPDVDSEHTGDLHDPEAVLEMIGERSTLPVEPSGSCAARSSSTGSTPWRIDWSAERDGRRLSSFVPNSGQLTCSRPESRSMSSHLRPNSSSCLRAPDERNLRRLRSARCLGPNPSIKVSGNHRGSCY
jgi:hypothetical protein